MGSAVRHATRRRCAELRDWRDARTGDGPVCHTCQERDAIVEEEALTHGLNWKEYSAHPLKLKTCWACKNAHDSVMTQAMAGTKYSGTLKDDPAFFAGLRRQRRSFHHRPEYGGEFTRNSEYFWVSDLRPEAERRGWLSKEAKAAAKQQKEAEATQAKVAKAAAKAAAKVAAAARVAARGQ